MHGLIQLGPLRIPITGLFAASGLVLALLLAQRIARYAQVAAGALWDAGLTAILAALIASRLILIAFNWHTFLSFPFLVLTLPSLTGLGLLLAAIAEAIFLRVRRLPALRVADTYAAPALLLWAVFALGDLVAGEHSGLPTSSAFSLYDPLWGRVLPAEPLTAVLGLLAAGLLLRQLVRPHIAGTVAARGVALFGAAWFVACFIRQPDPMTISLLLDPEQWMALACVVAGGITEAVLLHRGDAEIPAELITDLPSSTAADDAPAPTPEENHAL